MSAALVCLLRLADTTISKRLRIDQPKRTTIDAFTFYQPSREGSTAWFLNYETWPSSDWSSLRFSPQKRHIRIISLDKRAPFSFRQHTYISNTCKSSSPGSTSRTTQRTHTQEHRQVLSSSASLQCAHHHLVCSSSQAQSWPCQPLRPPLQTLFQSSRHPRHSMNNLSSNPSTTAVSTVTSSSQLISGP